MTRDSNQKSHAGHPAFTRFARWISRAAGEPSAFIGGLTIIVTWAALGPVAGFGDTWQLVINTGTTIVTFLMVFVIQNTQNRDTAAMQIKLDELIRATTKADNSLLNLEELEENELEALRSDYERLADKARETLQRRRRER
ncbi:MAG: low affinity iron permease family protein [Panacagrimonas sp.]